MTQKPSEYNNALEELKERCSDTLDEGKLIVANIQRGIQEGKIVETARLMVKLEELIGEIDSQLLPALQKELSEAVISGAKALDAFDQSSTQMKRVLALLKYHYGPEEPEVIEFFSPPNWWGMGTHYDSRIRAHKRLNEAFDRRKEEFGTRQIEDFEKVAKVGESLDQAWKAFQKEAGEADTVLRRSLDLLANYRKLRRKIRNFLKAELDNPSDAYDYIPKRVYKKKPSETPQDPPSNT